MSIIIYLFEFQLPHVLPKSRIFKFLKRDCGTVSVAEITSGKNGKKKIFLNTKDFS
jgi:hypothetical protein